MRQPMEMTIEHQKISLHDIMLGLNEDFKSHSSRVGEYALAIAIELKNQGIYSDNKLLKDDVLHFIRDAVFLHDVGQVFIPQKIIKRQRKLAYREEEIYQRHTIFGAEILKQCLEESQYKACVEIAIESAISHHERYDGQGYPYGTSGQNIPLIGRICAVADAYVHYTSLENNLRLSRDDAINIILKESGTKFDSIVVDAFIKAIQIVDCCHEIE